MRNQINMVEFMGLVKTHFEESEIKTIMEIGSLNGADSLFFKETFPNSDVYCIEGLPENYEKYLKDLTSIIPINIVIADYDGEITYFKKNINGIHGIFNRGDEYGTETLVLKCKKIDTICADYDIKSIDVVKIDVEGATFEILKSMCDFLQTIKIMHIETETYDFFKGQKLHDEVSNLLIENGFTMIDMTSVAISGNHEQRDSVWINNKHYRAI